MRLLSILVASMVVTARSVAGPPLVIVHPPDLEALAGAWSKHRAQQGWECSRIVCPAEMTAESLQAVIKARLASLAPQEQGHAAVLLLGRVPTKDAAGVPTFRIEQPDNKLWLGSDRGFASDGPYQDLDGDGVPDVMLGRVPAVSEEEGRALLAKIIASESAPPGSGSRRVEVVGGEGHFGAYDALLEMLTATLLSEMVPAEFDLEAVYAKPGSVFCPPPSELAATARKQALSGAFLFNYVGHGHPTGFDSFRWQGRTTRILESRDLPQKAETPAPGPRGVALLVCCSTGSYDLTKGGRSLAESLLFAPDGPIAVIAGSRPTHPYANAIMEREGITRLFHRPSIAGGWDLEISRALATESRDQLDTLASPIAAQQRWPMTLAAMRRQHALLYNLIGDPATRIAYPAPAAALRDLSISQGAVSGAIDAPDGAHVTIHVDKRRSGMRPELKPAGGEDDPEIEAIAARNWPRANDWTLWKGEGRVEHGAFTVMLPSPLPEGAAVVTVSVEEGPALLGLSALRIPAPLLRSGSDG